METPSIEYLQSDIDKRGKKAIIEILEKYNTQDPELKSLLLKHLVIIKEIRSDHKKQNEESLNIELRSCPIGNMKKITKTDLVNIEINYSADFPIEYQREDEDNVYKFSLTIKNEEEYLSISEMKNKRNAKIMENGPFVGILYPNAVEKTSLYERLEDILSEWDIFEFITNSNKNHWVSVRENIIKSTKLWLIQ